MKRIIVTSIALLVGGLHFITGENYRGPFPVFVNGYMIDILLPMTMVLLMGLFQTKWLRSYIFRVFTVFGFGCFVEASQYLGYPFLGSTFDPLDILAYAGGVLLGILLDFVLFSWLAIDQQNAILQTGRRP
jgi:hypothetical protein